MTPSDLPLSLYIHVPWCVRKCPYCDFNSHARDGALPVDAYVDAVLTDLDRDLESFGAAIGNREIASVFFGGGTPSLFAPDATARLIDGAASRLVFRRGIEITMETNPGTVEHGRFDEYLDAGVTRISFGVQSFDDDKLRRLGRIHSAAEADRAIKTAQDAGFYDINLDLMYALPEQTLDGALADVEQAIAFRPSHISHYQLTLEPNTLFAAKPPPLPDIDAAWDMQEACQRELAEACYSQYEVSAYSRDGKRCKHNLNYWTFGDYLGVGAGAHGKITTADSRVVRTAKVKLPRSYLDRAARRESFGTFDDVAAEQLAFEFMLNALRLDDGVPIATFEQRTGLSRNDIAAPLAEARERGWLETDPSALRPTESGRRFLNDLIALFLPD
ncbi:MAG TPA: radical SAM family heme chaperone HemW [Rhodanobacteraceae bacterium]|jgi:oxygen-independent coproporphyrinogen-3 oxidase|nr:radical SAM family heme chaperone HemW [Rhodanobacteraceae bacterium]